LQPSLPRIVWGPFLEYARDRDFRAGVAERLGRQDHEAGCARLVGEDGDAEALGSHASVVECVRLDE